MVRSTGGWPGWREGLRGGLVLVAVSGCGRLFLGSPFVPELMADRLFAWVPMDLFRLFIAWLGFAAKWVAFAGTGLVYLAAAGAAGALWLRLTAGAAGRAAGGWRRPLGSGLFLGAGTWLLTLAAFVPLARGGSLGQHLWPGGGAAEAALLVAHLAYGLAVVAGRSAGSVGAEGPPVRRRAQRHDGKAPRAVRRDGRTGAPPGAPPRFDPGRRQLLVVGVAAAGLAGLTAVIRWGSLVARAAAESAAGVFARIRGLPPEITPIGSFYTVSKNLFDPRVNTRNWSLEVAGHVERPAQLTYEDLVRLPAVELPVTLTCISNPIGGDLISNAVWRGPRLRDVLALAQVRDGAVDVAFRAYDGYSDSIPLANALHADTLVAIQMNGEPLPHQHGFPARIIVPGLYGIKNVKWVTRIEPVTRPFYGFWQERGWSYEGIIRTSSRVDVPRSRTTESGEEVLLGGIAFGGDRGIRRVEYSTDGGETWQEAVLKETLGPYTWVLWAAAWRPPATGQYRILVRAVDGTGQRQIEEEAPALPDGATGLHAVTVNVRLPRS